MLKIIGRQINRGQEDTDIIEFITEGKMRNKGDSIYLQYDEGDISGMAGCRTMLKITDKRIRMKRFGGDVSLDTVIDFERGKRFIGVYDTPYGSIEMEVLTNMITNKIDKENAKGTIDIDYHMNLKGLSGGRNVLNIEIM